MKTITTKYHGATNTRGSRVSATTQDLPRRYYSYDHGQRDMHRHAALAYCVKHEWQGFYLAEGGLSVDSRVWVLMRSGADLILIGEVTA